ncbi:MAG TPA: helix-turn-helix transcriptional regulator [Pseudolabrys sp.]|nr:helix-turn-helix transcriptional regulator [Pseudolabrys sp.]
MTIRVAGPPRDFTELFRLERHAFAARIRLARAVLGWSQSELGFRIGMTQRAIHKLEQGETEPRRTTMRALEEVWREHSIEFEDLADGGFRVSIRAAVLEQPLTARARRRRTARVNLGVTAIARPAS